MISHFIFLITLFLIGYITTRILFKKIKFIELLGYLIFFSISIVPWVSINFNLIFDSVSNLIQMMSIAIIILAILIYYVTKNNININLPNMSKFEFIFLFVIFIISIFSYFYYNNSVYYLSLASYVERGETNCFYMLTFALQPELKDMVNTDTRYDILSTPGNSMFTSFIHPVFEFNSFRVMYIIFQILIFLFTYLLIDYLLKKKWISLTTALFSIFNPFNLFIEVLDRNFMALVVSIILIYTLFKHKKKYMVHGFIFGILASLGLRFLPIIFILPVLYTYFNYKTKIDGYVIFIITSLLMFMYNLPHLKYHGFNSIGEKLSYLELANLAFTEFSRTPFVPFPNLIFFIELIFYYLGYIVVALLIFGVLKLLKKNIKHFYIFITILLLSLFTLSIQRDILESAKIRIFIMSFSSIFVFFAYGLSKFFMMIKKDFKKTLVIFSFIIFILFLFVQIFSTAEFNEDESFYEKKLLYQEEGKQYYTFSRAKLSDATLLPGYNKLGHKLNLGRKINEQDAVIFNLNKRFENSGYLDNEFIQEPVGKFDNEFTTIKINFEKLIMDIDNSVSIINNDNDLFIDFSKKDELLDVYYNEFDVSWQSKSLPLVIFPNFADTKFLNEIYLDLNSFISYGQDDFGFEQINSVNYLFYSDALDYAKQTSMIALPKIYDNKEIILKIPRNHKIIIRNWFVNGANSQPFKIDSWVISIQNENPMIEFWYNEPESYI